MPTAETVPFPADIRARVLLALGQALLDAPTDGDRVDAALEMCVEYARLEAAAARALEAERAASRRARDQAASYHAQVLVMAGHDLRSPIGAILIATEMLARAGDPDGVRAAARITTYAGRMTRLLDELVDVTRAQDESLVR